MSFNWTEILIPIGVCVVLPIMIVWLVTGARKVAVNRKYDLLHAAIEKGVEIDPNLLIDPKKEGRSIKMQLLNKLQWGIGLLLGGIIVGVLWVLEYIRFEIIWLTGVVIAVGATLIAVYFIGKRDLKHEIEEEESRK